MVYHVRKNFKEQYAQQPMQVQQQPMQVQQPMQELPRIEKTVMKVENPRFLQAEVNNNTSSTWFDKNKEWFIPVLFLLVIALIIGGYFGYKYYKGKYVSAPDVKPSFYYF